MSNLSELLPTGGGQNSVEFVASGTLASGQAVALKTDGTVTAITGQVGTATTFASGANATLNTGMCFDPDNNKVIIAYRDTSSSPYSGYAVVGTVSGMSISFGTPVAFYSSGSLNGEVTAVYDTTANKVVITFYPQAGGLYAVVGTVSGTSISFGSTANISAAPGYSSSVYDSSANKTLVSYSNSYPTVVAISVSGTTPSFGTPVVVVSAATQGTSLSYDTTANKSSLVVTHQSSSYLKAYAITISGTTPSAGSATGLGTFSNGADSLSTAYDPDINRHIVVFRDRTSGASQYFTNYIIFQISGTSIINNTDATALNNVNGGAPVVVYDTGSNKVVVLYNTASYTISAKVGTATVSSITFGDQITVEPAINQYSIGAVYDSAADRVVVGSYVGSGIVFNAGGIPNTSFIGITAEAISNAATGNVNVYGGINEAQSGLTIASDYYVQNDGTLNTATSVANYDIANASYTQAFSVASQDTQPSAIAFNPAGTKMFIAGNQGNDIGEYTLSTAFDVSTASFVDSFSVNSQETAPMGVAFNTDGTRMFVNGEAANTVFQYALSTGFDVSTASYTQGFSTAAQDSASNGIAFNTDGTKMFVTAESTKKINEYTLSSAFDVSTASYVDGFSVVSQSTQPKDTQFNSDGTEMYLVSRSPATAVYKYTLTTGFDVSTASYANVSFSIANEETSPQGLAFSANGSKMYVCGFTGQDVNEYATSTTVANSTTVKAGRAISATTINMKDLT